jgi:hypothetical protein
MRKGDLVEVRPQPPTDEELWGMAGYVEEMREDGSVTVTIPGGPGETSIDAPPRYEFPQPGCQLAVLWQAPPPKKPTLWNRIFWSHLLPEAKD